MSVYDESLKLHGKYHGKLKVEAKELMMQPTIWANW